MKTYVLIVGLAFLLVACGKDSTGPSGPPDLTMKDVVGCWKHFDMLMVKCFDKKNGYYFLWKDSQGDFYEDSGAYVISGYSVELTYRVITSTGIDRKGTGEDLFRRDGDNLRIVNSGGADGVGYFRRIVSIDTSSFGTPWRFFTKPAGWDSLVKPY